MKRVLAITTAVLLLGSTAAMARGYHPEHNWNRGYYGHHDNDAGAAIAGGILGFALGALATSQNHDYYAPAYAAPAYGYQGYNYGAYGAPPYGYGNYAAPGYGYGYGGSSVNLGFGF